MIAVGTEFNNKIKAKNERTYAALKTTSINTMLNYYDRIKAYIGDGTVLVHFRGSLINSPSKL